MACCVALPETAFVSEVLSAGTEADPRKALAIRVRREIGVGTSTSRSQRPWAVIGSPFDHVITVMTPQRKRPDPYSFFSRGCRRLHWSFEGPLEGRGLEGGAPAVCLFIFSERCGTGSRSDCKQAGDGGG